VVGLDRIAAKWQSKYASYDSLNNNHGLKVSVTAPDVDWTLAQQIEPYIDASSMLLGHGGGMFYALFLKDNATVIEVTSLAKHSENNGAARGLFTIGSALNLNVKRIVCYEGGAFTVDLMGKESRAMQTPSEFNPAEFEGDVSDLTTPCGARVQEEMDKVVAYL
jgi:hypothetical protein